MNCFGDIRPAGDSKKTGIINDISRYIAKNPVPLETTFEITRTCNLKCLHCYNHNRRKNQRSPHTNGVLATSEILDTINQVRDAGCLSLTLTGGEPLMHPDVVKLIRYARSLKLAVFLKTNGSLLSETCLKNLLKAKLMGVDISLYGASPGIHDIFTGVPGSFAKSLQAVKLSSLSGLKTRLVFTLANFNYLEAPQMIRLAEQTGVDYEMNAQLSARYDGSPKPLRFRLNRRQLKQLYAGPLKNSLPRLGENPAHSIQCGCAMGLCGISAGGDVYPCISAPVAAGNIRDSSFEDIWKHSPLFKWIRRLTLEDFSSCRSCPDLAFCRRSSGLVYANTGQYTGTETWTCMEAGIIRELNSID